jgi:hypothetical protein
LRQQCKNERSKGNETHISYHVGSFVNRFADGMWQGAPARELISSGKVMTVTQADMQLNYNVSGQIKASVEVTIVRRLPAVWPR